MNLRISPNVGLSGKIYAHGVPACRKRWIYSLAPILIFQNGGFHDSCYYP
jgi:hypothetical protein